MSVLDRRAMLGLLAALAATPAGAASPLDAIDAEGAALIGKAWLAARAKPPTAAALRADLFPRGEDVARLRSRVRADFRAGRLYAYRGWRLSDTEGRLFALLALTP